MHFSLHLCAQMLMKRWTSTSVTAVRLLLLVTFSSLTFYLLLIHQAMTILTISGAFGMGCSGTKLPGQDLSEMSNICWLCHGLTASHLSFFMKPR